MTWTYMELLTPIRHSVTAAKRWTVLGAMYILSQKKFTLHKCLFSIFPINEKLEEVRLNSIKGMHYAFAV